MAVSVLFALIVSSAYLSLLTVVLQCWGGMMMNGIHFFFNRNIHYTNHLTN